MRYEALVAGAGNNITWNSSYRWQHWGIAGNENIEGLLAKRHFIKKMRNATHKHHIKGPRKRTVEDDEKFTQAFGQLLDKVIEF